MSAVFSCNKFVKMAVIVKEAEALKQKLVGENPCLTEEEIFSLYMKEAFRRAENSDEFRLDVSRYFQYYNNDVRRALNKKKQAHERILPCEVHIVTQLFTPDYITRYVVDNSLGRLLYEGGIDLELTYLDRNSELTFSSREVNLEELHIIDPAVGTGNLLLYAGELLFKAYRKRGYAEDKLRECIANNLIGIDIDFRAVEVCKKLFEKEFNITPRVYTVEKPPERVVEILKAKGFTGLTRALHNCRELGSVVDFSKEEIDEILSIMPSVHALCHKYDVILINPPYLSSSDFNQILKKYVSEYYKEYGADLFSVFTAKYLGRMSAHAYMGIVCPYNWMFLKRFASIRKTIIENHNIETLAQLSISGYREATVYLSAYVIKGSRDSSQASIIKLSEEKDQEEGLKKAVSSYTEGVNFKRMQESFLLAPSHTFIYGKGANFIKNYAKGRLSDVMEIRQGLATGNNAYFLEKIGNVDINDVDFTATSYAEHETLNKKYALYSKGGEFRKWFGNLDYVIKFDEEAREKLKTVGNKMPSREFYFRPAITWTLVSSKGVFGARKCEHSVFDVGGSCGFPYDPSDLEFILGYLCSKVATSYLNAQNPTINCQVGDLKNLPYVRPTEDVKARVTELVKECVEIAKTDWLASDASYLNKGERPIITKEEAKLNFDKMKKNEEELNAIFIKLYGLEDALTPEVEDRLITLKH